MKKNELLKKRAFLLAGAVVGRKFWNDTKAPSNESSRYYCVARFALSLCAGALLVPGCFTASASASTTGSVGATITPGSGSYAISFDGPSGNATISGGPSSAATAWYLTAAEDSIGTSGSGPPGQVMTATNYNFADQPVPFKTIFLQNTNWGTGYWVNGAGGVLASDGSLGSGLPSNADVYVGFTTIVPVVYEVTPKWEIYDAPNDIGDNPFYSGSGGEQNEPATSDTVPFSFTGLTVTPTITYDSGAGTTSIHSLTVTDPFIISGGQLDVASTSSFSNTLTMSGGTLGGSGDITTSGAVTVTGGDFGGTGTLNVMGGITFDTTAGNLFLAMPTTFSSAVAIKGGNTLYVIGGPGPTNVGAGGSVDISGTSTLSFEAASGDFQSGSSTTIESGSTLQVGPGGEITLESGASVSGGGDVNVGGPGVFTQSGAAIFTQNGGAFDPNKLEVGVDSAGSGNFMLSGGSMQVAGGEDIGVAGAGTLTQTSGTNSTSDLTIGDQSGATGTLQISGKSTLTTTGDGILGSQTGSTGTATITDAGTEWQINGELKVGDKGDGTMSVENGGLVSLAGNLAIADSGGTSTLTLDGNGSRLIASGTSVTIGGKGDGTLIVQNAADAVVSGAGVSLGEQTTGTGTLTVQGSNTVMSAGSLTIGGYGTGTLNVQDSASLSTGTNISLGEQASGTGTATIDSAAVNDAGSLTVGGYGNGTMTIQDGGSLTVQGNDVTLGEQNTGSGTLNLSGSGSALTFNGDMTVGKSGSGTFAVSGGADFNGSAMTLASGSGFGGASTGGTGELDINGASSVLLSHDLTIGKYGVGTLAMASGAVLANKGDATLGSQPGTEGSATISSDSNWTVGGSLTDGSQGTGSITVQGGSSLIANGDTLTVGKQGEGSLTVTDTKSSVQYAGDLIIGKQSSGTFSIDAGAVTKPTSSGTGEVYIAETSGINGTLNIDGSGSSLSGTDMVVGGTGSQAGGTGLVSLTNGGQINLTGKLAMWKDGTINTAGGAITLGTAGSTSPANGNVYINSQGELSGTGTITGNVTNSGGTLNIGGTQPGNLNITGNFTQSSGTFKVAIGGTGTGQASQLDATGSVSFTGGTVEFDFVNHYAPQKGQTFQFIDPPQSVSVNNVSYTFTGLAPGFDFSVTPDTNGLLFTALNNAVATPEPADMRLMLAGSIPFLLVRRKRRKLTL